MNNALIGYTGFLGSTLLRQTHFNGLFRSTNIGEIQHQSFDYVLCAGVPAQKWHANQNPEIDFQNIACLMQCLKHVRCKKFILISTVDVFQYPVGVDENTAIQEEGLHPYGLHRYQLEKFIAAHFEQCLIVRLSGLVGPGLRKNIIFDFLNKNNLHAIDSRGVFQFYPTVNLWSDIQVALNAGLRLVHLTAEPIPVADVAAHGFGLAFQQVSQQTPAHYDIQSCHAALFGGQQNYQYNKRESLLAIRAYAQSEQHTSKE